MMIKLIIVIYRNKILISLKTTLKVILYHKAKNHHSLVLKCHICKHKHLNILNKIEHLILIKWNQLNKLNKIE